MKRDLTFYLSLVLVGLLAIQHPGARSEEKNSEPFAVECNPPKQEGNAVVVALLIIGGIMAYCIYKCAKKGLYPPPPPPPPPPSNTCTNAVPGHPEWPHTNCHPHVVALVEGPSQIFQWGSATDFTSVTQSMAGMSYSATNAFITLYDWPNTWYVDDDGVPYNAWFCGALPVQTSEDLVNWRRSITVTGWISPGWILATYYNDGAQVAQTYTSTATSPSPPGCPGSTNFVGLNLINPEKPHQFFRIKP